MEAFLAVLAFFYVDSRLAADAPRFDPKIPPPLDQCWDCSPAAHT